MGEGAQKEMINIGGNNLTISWIGRISVLALVSAVVGLIINACTVKDTTLFAALLTVAAIAGNGVGALGGHLQREDDAIKKAAFTVDATGNPQIGEEKP